MLLGALGAGAILLAAGCGASREAETGQAETGRASAVGGIVSNAANVHEASGHIVLPLDEYGLSHRERAILEYARGLVVRRCMRAQRLDYLLVDRRRDPEEPSRLYGVWNVQSARKFGYAVPPESRGSELLERESQRQREPSERRALARCEEDAAGLGVREPGPAEVAAFNLYRVALSSEEAQDVLEAWHHCLAVNGIAPPSPDDPWIPTGVRATGSQRIALKDVRCKKRVDLVQQLAEIEARVQVRWAQQHLQDLVRQRRKIERALDLARETIATRSGRE